MSLATFLVAPRKKLQNRAAQRTRSRSHRPRLLALEDRLVPSLMGNPLFPSDNPWNQKITSAPVDPNSATYVASIGTNSVLHPDFGTTYAGALNGIPINVVPGTQPKVTVVVDAYASESDVQPVPIPANAVIEGDPLPSSKNKGDRHLIVYDQDNNIAYECFNTHKPSETNDGKWHADSEAVWDMKKDSFRPQGWTSADAAGLPILPGLVRPDEVLDQGVITHALRFTVPHSQNTWIFPASHQAGSANASFPPMGARFRLIANFDISGFSKANQVILQALKDYGMIVADNGSGWYLSGQPSPRWNDNDLHNLSRVIGNNFEMVNLKPVVTGINPAIGIVTGGTQVTVNGYNFSGGAGLLKVKFGSTPATAVSIVSDTTIVATAPAHAAGTVDVQVASPYGNSPLAAADQFTFGSSGLSAGETVFVSGADAGMAPEVKVFDGRSGAVKLDFLAFNAGFTGGVRVSVGDVNGDGVSDILAAAGPGGGPDVRVFDGATGTLLMECMAFPVGFSGGVYVAAGDVSGDGHADLVVGADSGGGPNVRVLNGKDCSPLADYMAYNVAFTGGARVAAGDVNGDGYADVVTAAGAGGGPHVIVWDGRSVASGTPTAWRSFFAYTSSFHGGVYVATGDVNGDGKADVITGAGAGGGPHVKVFSGTDNSLLQNFFAFPVSFTGGVRVGFMADVNSNGRAEIVAGAGPSGGPSVEVFDGGSLAPLDNFFAYNAQFTGGVFVGGR